MTTITIYGDRLTQSNLRRVAEAAEAAHYTDILDEVESYHVSVRYPESSFEALTRKAVHWALKQSDGCTFTEKLIVVADAIKKVYLTCLKESVTDNHHFWGRILSDIPLRIRNLTTNEDLLAAIVKAHLTHVEEIQNFSAEALDYLAEVKA